MVINSPCCFNKDLASPKQTNLGKDKSNPFMAGSLPKTIWLSMHHVIAMKHWLLQSKRPLNYFYSWDMHKYRHLITTVSYKLLLFGPTKDAAVKLMLLGHKLVLLKFWATASIKNVNDVIKLQALIDLKKVVVTEDIIHQDLCLDDADGVECLPNEEIFAELARMGYEKQPPRSTFYKDFFSEQWKFFIHTLVQCVSTKRTAWNEFSCSMASAVICLATDSLFASMPVQPQAAEEEADVEEKCATLSQKVAALEQDKIAQSLEIIMLKNRVKKLEKKRRSKSSNLKRLRKGRITKDDDNATAKEVSAAEPTVFDDEEVTLTRAQTLIKMKAEKARILDEQMAKRLQDEEENIDWNVVAEKIQEKDLDNIRKYQSLKKKPISITQARKNMIIYLKNMVGYKIEHFRGMTYDKVRPIFEREYNKVQTLFIPNKDVEEPSKKRVTEKTLLQESFKKLKAVEVSGSESTQETPTNDPK
nr:hypothetical protein [Tanacetum cinerariifolium]